MPDYDIRPRSFGQIAADAEKLAGVWPELATAFAPLATKELPSRLWHLGTLQKRLAEVLNTSPELLFDIAATKTVVTPTDDEKERMQAHALRGEEAELNAITAGIMKRPGKPETGIERARRVFGHIERIVRVLMVLDRISGDDNIPTWFAAPGLISPTTRALASDVRAAFELDLELMQECPDEAELASFTVTVPGAGAYPIATGVVHVEPITRKVPRFFGTRFDFRIELSGSTHLIPTGRNDAVTIGGDSYRINVEPT